MGQQVTITSVTANTPVEIYYCDSMSASCVYVATVSTFPFIFDVPDPYDLTDYIIQITMMQRIGKSKAALNSKANKAKEQD